MRASEKARALLNSGDLKGAMTIVNGALNKDPDDMEMLMLGSCIVSRESCWGMSYNLLKRVADKAPPYPEVLNNLGMAASSLASSSGKDRFLDEAETYLRKALKKDVTVQSTANLALVMLHKGQAQAAEQLARNALKMEENVSARETLGYACLHQGNWIEGFGNYEFTLGGKYRKLPKGKYWEKGERGIRLFVRGEQGIGDEITYASVLPDASKHNSITYECDGRLEGLMKRSLPGIEVVGTRFDEEKTLDGTKFDSVALTGSLCMEYRQRDEDFPRKGFLIPDPERRLQWRTLLDTLPGRKIGIAWTGGLDNTFKHRRSFNLEGLLPILKIPGVTWVSLQYSDPSVEIEEFSKKNGIEIKHWARAVSKGVDYDDTAALVSELDSVVTVTTAIAHLCGALGKKAFVLVPKRARWFYQSDTQKHRWYESLELFRQEDKWPIERVAERLKDPHVVECGGCAPPVVCA